MREHVTWLKGRQRIRLAEEIEKRGGRPPEALAYNSSVTTCRQSGEGQRPPDCLWLGTSVVLRNDQREWLPL